MHNEKFTGDKKVALVSPTAALEKRFVEYWVRRIPSWLETYHLTLMTLAWSAGIIGFGWLAQDNPHWLWLSSSMIFLQWLTDCFDGAVGRLRNTGLVKWGFYMDHLLDYFFMGSIFVGLAFLLEGLAQVLMFILMLVYGGLEASAWLAFAATNKFKITFLGAGPTEVRLLFIAVQTAIIFFSTAWLSAALPWVLGASLLAIGWIAYNMHRELWQLDMKEKEAAAEQPDG